jgi:hypothetical protein
MSKNIFFSDILYIISGYAVIEAIILVVVLSILRKLDMLTSWKLIAYYAVVVVSSLFISFLLSSIGIHLGDPQQANLLFFSVFAVFTTLVFLNIALSKIIFAVNLWKACLFGIPMGLINALMVIASTTFYV